MLGRCMILNIQVGDITFQVINLHVEPKAPIAIKRSLFVGIKQRLASTSSGFALMGGDFNFDPCDEPRIKLDEAEAYKARDPLAKYFEEEFPEFIELQQDGYTRAHKINNTFTVKLELQSFTISSHRTS